MLVDHVSQDKFDAVIVVENDDRLADAICLARKLRAAQFATEIVATGSPRKRFDKAAKLSSHTLISLSVADGTPSMRIRGEGSDIAARVEAFIVGAN
jgi:histidyl-tRNA synthetase